MGNAEELRQGASGLVDGLLASEQLLPYRAWPAPCEVRVGERVVADLVPGSYLGGEVWLALDVVATWKKVALMPSRSRISSRCPV